MTGFLLFLAYECSKIDSYCQPYTIYTMKIDLLRKFHIAKSGQYQFLIIVVEYFTKLVEAEPLPDIKASSIENFVWKSIISGFGMPKVIITNSGTQFNCKSFKDSCQKWTIKL